jgi:hypothetical protein
MGLTQTTGFDPFVGHFFRPAGRKNEETYHAAVRSELVEGQASSDFA